MWLCAETDIKTQLIWDANNREPKRSDNREYTGCVTKIRTNFNLNFPLYCASAREIIVGIWESLMLLVNILEMATMMKSSAEYNQRAAIIENLRAQQRK